MPSVTPLLVTHASARVRPVGALWRLRGYLKPFRTQMIVMLAAALGAWFLAEAHGLDARVRSAQPPANEPAANQPAEHQPAEKAPSPAPMRLFHLSIAYLTLLFAAVAVTALLPWGRW